jgi:hypothetical protein
MKAEDARALREPFPPDLVDKLPKVWCKACRDAEGKVCGNHAKVKCGDCGNNITKAHLHVDYVGHAEVTDRLIAVDPSWTWEPVAYGQDGLPQLDRNGGLWIKLTVAGVTRLGYGHADGKNGGDAIKETIGDAIKTAAVRFGVALDLKRKHRAELTAAQVRSLIAAAGAEKGMEPDVIAEDFTAWSQGARITVDDVRLLGDYLRHLQS